MEHLLVGLVLRGPDLFDGQLSGCEVNVVPSIVRLRVVKQPPLAHPGPVTVKGGLSRRVDAGGIIVQGVDNESNRGGDTIAQIFSRQHQDYAPKQNNPNS